MRQSYIKYRAAPASLVIIITMLLFTGEAQGQWFWISSEAVHFVLVCQDGIHLGVGVDSTEYGMEAEQVLEVRVEANLDQDQDFAPDNPNEAPLVEDVILPVPRRRIPIEFGRQILTHSDYFTIFWSRSLSPGTNVLLDIGGGRENVTIQDCYLAHDTTPHPHPYRKIPTIHILSVEPGDSATFRTRNYPPNQTFTVTMGPIGTRGINGEVVGIFNSEAGGELIKTFEIPENLREAHKISIRAQTSHRRPYFSFNYFVNQADIPPTPQPDPEPGAEPDPEPVTVHYSGIPAFKICSVERNQAVTIETNNFPPNQTFNVTMSPIGTRGISGEVVSTFNSDAGGAFTKTFDIPANVQNAQRIAIRVQTSHQRPYFAFNWFYNNTASVCS